MLGDGLLPRMPAASFGLGAWPVATGGICPVKDWTSNRNLTAPCSLPSEITASTSCGFGFEQGKAKQLIHEMYVAPTRKAALAAYGQFIFSYQTN
jgi:hypothetical protein